METLIQTQTRINRENWEKDQGKLGSFAGVVVSVQPTTDELGMSFGPAPERRMPVQHPFVGSTSWIRSMPEVGTTFLMQNRFDSAQAEAIKTLPVGSRERSREYLNSLNLYRPIYPGEHDITSTGSAMAFFGRRGALDLRSGVNVKLQLSRENQDITSLAPTHRRNLLFETAGEMGDEERLGIVKRWKTATEEFYPQENSTFRAERYLQVKNPAGAGPEVLLRQIEGHVYDDAGVTIKHSTTALPLRGLSQWYTTNDEFVSREIDQNGNVLMSLPDTASTGYEVLIPEGNYRKVVGKSRDVQIGQDEKVVVEQNIFYTVKGLVDYNVTKNYHIASGENDLLMDVKNGSVHFLNPSQYGITSTDAGGGSTVVSGPQGNLTIIPASATLTSNSDSLSLKGGTTLLTSKEYKADVDRVYLGKNATIPAMLGLTTLSWLDQHDHISSSPGNKTSTPVIPASSFNGTVISLVSSYVLLRGNL